MDQKNKLDLQVDGFRCLTVTEGSDDWQRLANATIGNENELINLCKLEELGAIESHYQPDGQLVEFSEINVDKLPLEVEVEFKPLNLAEAQFVWNLDALLQMRDYRVSMPTDYFVADINYRQGDAEKSLLISRYSQTLDLVQLLKRLSAHEPEPDHFIFLGMTKLDLRIIYSSSDLIDLEGISRLCSEVAAEDHHHQQRLDILKKFLIDSLSSIKSELRFSYLLSHFTEISDRFRRNFQLYAQDFTLKKQV